MGGRRIKKYRGDERLERENEARVVKNSDSRTRSKRERRKSKRHGPLHGRDNHSKGGSNWSVERGKNKDGDERRVSFCIDNDLFFENRRREGELDGNTVYWELKKG